VIRLGIVTGLASEADCLEFRSTAKEVGVLCAGADAGHAEDAARKLIAQGCAGLMSFGIAGGLDPALDAGALVVADGVVLPDGSRLETDVGWRHRLLEDLGPVIFPVSGDLVGSDGAVLDERQKKELREKSGAVAVDMESHAVARVAAECAVPFLVVRAVSDISRHGIPAWVPGTIRPDGRPGWSAVASGMLAHPGDLPTLLRLRSTSRKAMATLRRVALRAGPLFFLLG
jgi:adenosylhomocysteine nucleosidase